VKDVLPSPLPSPSFASKAALKQRGSGSGGAASFCPPFFLDDAAAAAFAVTEAQSAAHSSPLEGSYDVAKGMPSSPARETRVSLKRANCDEREKEREKIEQVEGKGEQTRIGISKSCLLQQLFLFFLDAHW